MKKRIFMLLIAMVMMLRMTQVVMADDIKYYDVSGIIYLEHTGGAEYQISDAKFEYSSEYALLIFSIDNIEHCLKLTPIEGTTDDSGFIPCDVEYDGEYKGIQYDYAHGIFSVRDNEWGMKIGTDDFFIGGHLYSTETSAESQTHYIVSGFTTIGLSDSGVYELYISGHFTQELTNGVHTLTSADINAQTIAIVAYNNTNGIKRVMRENTIEEMTVTVSGGHIIEATIRGRVQTNGGTLDRYTAIIQ